MTTTQDNPQIDKYIKPIIKTYLTSVSKNEYGLSNIKTKDITKFLKTCDMDDIKSITNLYNNLRKASWSKDVDMMSFLIRCIETFVIVNDENE